MKFILPATYLILSTKFLDEPLPISAFFSFCYSFWKNRGYLCSSDDRQVAMQQIPAWHIRHKQTLRKNTCWNFFSVFKYPFYEYFEWFSCTAIVVRICELVARSSKYASNIAWMQLHSNLPFQNEAIWNVLFTKYRLNSFFSNYSSNFTKWIW